MIISNDIISKTAIVEEGDGRLTLHLYCYETLMALAAITTRRICNCREYTSGLTADFGVKTNAKLTPNCQLQHKISLLILFEGWVGVDWGKTQIFLNIM